ACDVGLDRRRTDHQRTRDLGSPLETCSKRFPPGRPRRLDRVRRRCRHPWHPSRRSRGHRL
ncbi:MAG: hypothetical protein AVDCRST_MAG34-715, partial [uncultured Nocardioidaceae bacterium]